MTFGHVIVLLVQVGQAVRKSVLSCTSGRFDSRRSRFFCSVPPFFSCAYATVRKIHRCTSNLRIMAKFTRGTSGSISFFSRLSPPLFSPHIPFSLDHSAISIAWCPCGTLGPCWYRYTINTWNKRFVKTRIPSRKLQTSRRSVVLHLLRVHYTDANAPTSEYCNITASMSPSSGRTSTQC